MDTGFTEGMLSTMVTLNQLQYIHLQRLILMEYRPARIIGNESINRVLLRRHYEFIIFLNNMVGKFKEQTFMYMTVIHNERNYRRNIQ